MSKTKKLKKRIRNASELSALTTEISAESSDTNSQKKKKPKFSKLFQGLQAKE